MNEERLHEQIRRFWNVHPHAYHAGRGTPEWIDFRNIDRKVLKLHTPWAHTAFPLLHKLVPYEELRGKRVLDLGCGTGWGLEQLTRAGARGIGLDLARIHLEWTRRRFACAGAAAELVEGDGGRLPFAAGSFDYVLAWGVIMHAREPGALAAEIHRVLAPGARAGVLLYHARSLHWCWTLSFLHGMARLWRNRSETLRRHANNPEIGGSPLARAYSRAQARALFGRFARVEVRVFDQGRAMGFFPSKRLPLALLLPPVLRRALARRIGFYLWLELVR